MEDPSMDEPRIDLSALDVHADALRFEQTVGRLTAAVRQPQAHPLLADLARRGRFALAAAAALAVAAWTPSLVGSRREQPLDAPAWDPGALVAEWAQAGAIPADATLFHLTGSTDVR